MLGREAPRKTHRQECLCHLRRTAPGIGATNATERVEERKTNATGTFWACFFLGDTLFGEKTRDYVGAVVILRDDGIAFARELFQFLAVQNLH